MITNIGEFQIFGNGESLMLLFEVESKQYAYVLKNPMCSSVQIQLPFERQIFSNYGDELTPISDFPSIEAVLLSHSFEYQEGENLLFRLDYFQNKTIKELFQIINHKLKEREKERKHA